MRPSSTASPGPDDRPPGRSLGVWLIAAAPAGLLALALIIPWSRQRLLERPAGPTPDVVDATDRADLPAPSSSATPPPQSLPKAAPAPAAPPSLTPVAAPREPAPGAAKTPAGDNVVVAESELGDYLTRAYERELPAAVGPITTAIEGGVLTMSSTVDLEALRQELSGQVPDAVGLLLRGQPRIDVAGRLDGGEEGIANFHLEDVRIEGLRLPTRILRQFLAGELEARGYVAEDPLVRPIFLPEGFGSADLVDGGLRLYRAAPER